MREVKFDADGHPADMIEDFLAALEEEDPVMTGVLRAAIEHLKPLPPAGQERNQKRQEANAQVEQELDRLMLSEDREGKP